MGSAVADDGELGPLTLVERMALDGLVQAGWAPEAARALLLVRRDIRAGRQGQQGAESEGQEGTQDG